MRPTFSAVALLSLASAALAALPPEHRPAARPLLRLAVDAGQSPRVDTPVSAVLSDLRLDLTMPMRLEELTRHGRLVVPSQIEAGPVPRLWWILAGTTAAGATRRFELVADEASAPATPAASAKMPAAPAGEIRLDERALKVLQAGRPVLQYNHAPVPPAAGASPLFTRGGYVHPLYSPSGAILTETRPADHLHHLGLWNAWTKTRFDGRETDFWNLGEGQGTVRCARVLARTEGPVFAAFRVLQEHVALNTPGGAGGETVVLLEELEYRLFAPSAGSPDRWLLELTSEQRCATDKPLEIEAYRYGGLGFRGTREWNAGDYLTSEGKTRVDGHATRARWCLVFGPTRRGAAGVLFMSHPQNRQHPEPLRIWNDRPEIFFNFCPVQEEAWTLAPGQDVVLRYRLEVYDGRRDATQAEHAWLDFAMPPTVRVVPALPARATATQQR